MSNITDGYSWEILSDNTIKILSYTKPITTDTTTPGATTRGGSISLFNTIIITITIPDTFNEKPVTIIGANAFQNNTTFNRVVIPSTVISIEESAFSGCSQLKYLSFYEDSKLKYIKANAFKDTNINSPIIPASVTSIEDSAFDTLMLKNVTFLGNAPLFTENSFNSQQSNGNMSDFITLIYYKNAFGFSNPNSNKFSLISNNRMIDLPEETAVATTASSSNIFKYIIYFLLGVLLVLGSIYIVRRYRNKSSEYTTSNEGANEGTNEGEFPNINN